METVERFRQAGRRSVVSLVKVLPVVFGVLGLASLVAAALPAGVLARVLPMEGVFGPLLGAFVGGVAAGHPLTSYLLAGEFAVAGIGMATITAFIVSWVTVGFAHIPIESATLGLRFALWRNAISFVSAVLIGYLTAAVVPLL
jgi:uncharacterized membrane protein YraQ (UPF0718 family)